MLRVDLDSLLNLTFLICRMIGAIVVVVAA